jgi:hypothetical protein
MTAAELLHIIERLNRKINGALVNRPALRAVVNAIASEQPVNASLEEVHANLRERASAMVKTSPELDGYFDA